MKIDCELLPLNSKMIIAVLISKHEDLKGIV